MKAAEMIDEQLMDEAIQENSVSKKEDQGSTSMPNIGYGTAKSKPARGDARRGYGKVGV